jgi:hypothetical protein
MADGCHQVQVTGTCHQSSSTSWRSYCEIQRLAQHTTESCIDPAVRPSVTSQWPAVQSQPTHILASMLPKLAASRSACWQTPPLNAIAMATGARCAVPATETTSKLASHDALHAALDNPSKHSKALHHGCR